MIKIDPNTRFADLAEREVLAHDAHVNTVARLKQVQTKRTLSAAEQAELDLSEAILDEVAKSGRNNSKADDVCDPLFVATRTLLNEQQLIATELRTHEDGVLVFHPFVSFAAFIAALNSAQPPSDELPITLCTLTLGLLIADGVEAPPVKVVPQLANRTGTIAPPNITPNGKTLYPDWDHPHGGRFTREFFRAVGEARSYGVLADKVLALLGREGDPDGRGGATPTVRCEEFAEVMRKLADAKVNANEPQLRRRINEMLDKVQNVGSEDRVADLSIDLPDLEDIADQNIVAENVRVMGPMIVSAMFEELKVFQVVDRIVEQFQHGMLPIGPGEAGRMLYRYWREAPNRMSEQERRNFAAITLGIPGGDPGGMVNRDFNDLWIRFVSSVSSFIRQHEVDSLLRSATPSPISHQQVRKAARDLASNLSLHGYGMAHYAAREVQSQVSFMIKLLQDTEIRGCYGAKDMWQVVDQVATYELGGAKTSSRYRTLATCGTIITAWLANNVNRINRTTGPLINIDEVRNPPVAASHKATHNPNDYDLVNACELWLADTATQDSQVEELAQPREAPTMTSKPIPIPALAREMLDGLADLGVGLGRGMAAASPVYGNGSGYAYGGRVQ
jgi:hypothetical protein